MLPQKHRLRRMKDIDILMKEGRFCGGALVSVKLWWIDPAKYPRRMYSRDMLLIGFAVGKKVSKSAVKRNRIKRQMREVVRLLVKDNKLKVGALILLIAKPEIVGAEYSVIEKSIVDTLRSARLFT